ncbi:MAG: alpha/beta hydrolase [Gemmataceae bacterium]|nr:alpha/beta hydrolase [Gemmataceae bacterium]
MQATAHWLWSSGATYRPIDGRTGYAHLTHYTAEYCEWGAGPPLILIPGLAGGIRLLGLLANNLARDFRVIAYQLRGEDNCFAMRRPFGLQDLVDDLAEFIAWRGLEAPPILGVSFGGAIAMEFAARFPLRLNRLALQGVGSRFEGGLLQRIAGTVLSRFPLPTDSPFVNQFFNLLFGSAKTQDELFDFVTRQCWQTDQSVMAHRFQLVEAFNIEERLHRIRVPALIVNGERDLLVSRRTVQPLADGIADVQLRRVPGCGHLASVTHPEALAEHVRNFMGSV